MYYSMDTYDDVVEDFLDDLEGQFGRPFLSESQIDYANRPTAQSRSIPRDITGVSPNITHWAQVANIYRRIRKWFPEATVRVDKDRREHSRPASKKRPDIQFRHPQRHRATHIEVDTDSRNMRKHIAERDPRRRSVYVLIDGDTGQVVQKQIFPAGSDRPIIRHGELKRSDVFDEFDGAVDLAWWETPLRWGCKGKCAWMYGEGCRNACGFDSACISECTRKLYECNEDCDRRYP